MNYVTEYETCALFYLCIITVWFFSMRKFKSNMNKLFGIMLYGAILDLSLDVVGSLLIMNSASVPVWLHYVVNTAFYTLQVALPALIPICVVALAGKEITKPTLTLIIPALPVEALLLTNVFTGWIFTVTKTTEGVVFAHGGLFYLLYGIAGMYLVISVVLTLRNRHCLRKIEVRSIISFVVIILTAIFVQTLFPNVLLTGMGTSVAIFLMFLTMQNPESMLDSITRTFNYSAMTEYLRVEIAAGRPVWICAVDVGGIRRVNSMMGINTGNELLENVGEFFNSLSDGRVTAFRMIGTRFILFSDGEKTHRDIVGRVTDRFKRPWSYENTGITLMATVRYCESYNYFSAPEDVVNLIDIAYARVAEEGFGTTKPIDSTQLEQLRRKGEIKSAIIRAIENGDGFSLCYQPLYSVADGKYHGAEALLRFKDATLGQISPAEFIPIAESTDLIYSIDRMVVDMACSFLKKHPELIEAGLEVMEINLSALEFNNDTESLFAEISRDIKEIEHKICFEVTETAVTTRREVLSEFMSKMNEKGVRFAIDDFGTGYANITQLAKLPFSIVKLDKVFATQNDDKEVEMLRDLVRMFDHIGLSTVFEGIETPEQAAFAKELGIESIQGFYYSRPVSGDELIKLIIGQGGQIPADIHA